MRPPNAVAALLVKGWFSLIARILLTLPYWWSGLAKLADIDGALNEAGQLGFGYASAIVAATIGVQLTGSAMVISGYGMWLGAGALGVFTALATLIVHPFWMIDDPMDRFHALNIFLEHIGLIAGFMLVAVAGHQTQNEPAKTLKKPLNLQ